MSGSFQQETPVGLFDHLIGALLQRQGHVKTERLGGFEIDNEKKPCRLLDWQITRLGTLNQLVNVECRTPKEFGESFAITHQSAVRHVFTLGEYRRQSVQKRELRNS